MILTVVVAAYLLVGLIVAGICWRCDPPRDGHDYVSVVVFCGLLWPVAVAALLSDLAGPSPETAPTLAAVAALLALAALLLAGANGTLR